MLDLAFPKISTPGSSGASSTPSDAGVEPLVKHRRASSRYPMPAPISVYLCDAGFGLYFLGHWVRERVRFDIAEGVRRLTSHQARALRHPDRGRIASAPKPTFAVRSRDGRHFSVRRVNDLPGGGPRTLRDRSASMASSSTGQGVRRHRLCAAPAKARGGYRPLPAGPRRQAGERSELRWPSHGIGMSKLMWSSSVGCCGCRRFLTATIWSQGSSSWRKRPEGQEGGNTRWRSRLPEYVIR